MKSFFDPHHGYIESFCEWSVYFKKLPIHCQLNSAFWPGCQLLNLWAMGRLLCLNAPSECLSTRRRYERKCPQSPEYWRLVDLLAPTPRSPFATANPTAEGELVDLLDEFSDGKIQFAFVKIKDTNTALPKHALIGWCGEGVPERTKGYFTSHLAAVSKLLHVRPSSQPGRKQ